MTRRLLLPALMLHASLASAQSLPARLDARLDAPGLDRLLWGVTVTDLDGRVLYRRNAERLFTPASNAKLLVSATGLALLGPDFTVTTSVYGAGPVQDSVLQGDLVLYGRGDPTFSHRCYQLDTTVAGACDHDPATRLRELAHQVRAEGIRVVAGDLIGDGSWFEPTMIHPNWETYDLAWWYAAPVSGLGFNDNALDVTEAPGDSVGLPPTVLFGPDVGIAAFENRAETGPRGVRQTFDIFRSAEGDRYLATGVYPLGGAHRTEYVAVADPNRFTALAFRQALAAEGVIVRGNTRGTVDSLAYATVRRHPPLAESRSRPLRDWIFPILNSSQNWFAEMLLKQVGRQRGRDGSWSEGLRVERRFLVDSVGVDSTEFAMEDGSGLASNDLVAPLALARVLAWSHRQPWFGVMEAALPHSGQPGTLKTRLDRDGLAGRVVAKTGTISRTATLSGFVTRPDGRTLVFSVMANHHTMPGSRISAAIDSVVAEIVH
jgi:D-alanyl-D-alanine carboxypeptidase/D-alanyl-D-alanine-endopeptidase (penicillin-binding protein 4)